MKDASLSVTAIAWTHFDVEAAARLTEDRWWPAGVLNTTGAALVEYAGRSCYQSWAKPNPKTSLNPTYIAHLLEVGHLSVLEHGSVTLDIQGVSRSLTHELVRHRHFSYSQLSQRYVDSSDVAKVVPPALRGDDFAEHILERAGEKSLTWYDDLVEHLTEKGATRKEARQAARSVLANMAETKIVVTGNYRAWRHFIHLRASAGADVEIRELAVAALPELQRVAPVVFDDFIVVDGVATSPYSAR